MPTNDLRAESGPSELLLWVRIRPSVQNTNFPLSEIYVRSVGCRSALRSDAFGRSRPLADARGVRFHRLVQILKRVLSGEEKDFATELKKRHVAV